MIFFAWLVTFVAVCIAALTSLRAAQLRETLLAVNLSENSAYKTVDYPDDQGVTVHGEQSLSLGVWQWCPSVDHVQCSEALLSVLGCLSDPPRDLSQFLRRVHIHDRARLQSLLSSAVLARKPFRTRYRVLAEGGLERFVEMFVYFSKDTQGDTNLSAVVLDKTAEAHADRAHKINVYRCPITQMPNRAALQTTLADCIELGQHFAVVIFDLLNLKRINESLGLALGDQLIAVSGLRIQQSVPETCLLSHVGGGQFVGIVTSADGHQLKAQLEQVIHAFHEPVLLDTLPIKQAVSAGVAWFNSDADSVNQLLSCAHLALNHAKKKGHYCIAFYSRTVHAGVTNRLKLESALDQACVNGELELLFQPKVCANSHHVVGAEALLRWHSREFDGISPSEFISIAEHTEEILPIGRWVIEQSCEQLAQWQQQGCAKHFRLAMNLSPKQFADTSLVKHIFACLERYGLSPGDLEFEITESLLVGAFSDVKSQIETLRQAGIRVVIDDFGTGYSSFSYLQDYVFDGLKIDKSFVANSHTGGGNSAIIQAIVSVAKAFDMDVVAEGVESLETVSLMQQLGCDQLQGYYFGAAMSANDFYQQVFK